MTDVGRARLFLLTLTAVLVLGLAATIRSGGDAPAAPAGSGDVDMYQTVVRRLQAGDGYYDSIGGELRRRHYATIPAFNWRTPLLFTTLALAPAPLMRTLLIAAAAVLCLATWLWLDRRSRTPALVMELGVLVAVVVPQAVVMAEAWAGLFLGLSLVVAVAGHRRLAIVLALLGLFVRELAAPFCVVATLAAVVQRRWREVALWAVGAVVYAAYYAWHLQHVIAHRLPDDLVSSWVQFGGLSFVLSTLRWQGWLLMLPAAASALALTLVVAGILSSLTPAMVRVVSAIYIAFFLVAGQSFNAYWGLVAWPSWALACGSGFVAVQDALRIVSRGSVGRPAG